MLRPQLCSRVDLFARSASFHNSTTALLAQKFKNASGKGSSRLRLTKDLKPGSKSANLEVAHLPRKARTTASRDEKRGFRRDERRNDRSPKNASKWAKNTAEFVRDPLPHTDPGVESVTTRKNMVFASPRRRRQERDIRERPGAWSTELKASGHSSEKKPIVESTTKSGKVVSELSDYSTSAITSTHDSSQLPTKFTSPPLMSGILSCLQELIGARAVPTPIQALSLKWLLGDRQQIFGWKQFLLASETGSGKSLAYLLPLLQDLKQAELDGRARSPPPGPRRPLNPRALVLAPTHELSRQLSGFAKSLLHEVKMRVFCASQANLKSTRELDATARQMVTQLGAMDTGSFELKERSGFPVDVVVGTPMKLLELVKGRGWDRRESGTDSEPAAEPENHKPRRGRDKMVGVGQWRSKPELGLANVEWVVVDEADVLFDPDFQETTRQLLADISSARGHPIPVFPFSPTTASPTSPSTPTKASSAPAPIEYPFNFILTSATIPSSLANYLDTYHPKLKRLASPQLHHLPKKLQTEYVDWSGGNKLADVERRIRRVWSEDASLARARGDNRIGLTRILIFCNRSSAVEEMSKYLEEKGIKSVALSRTSEHRKRGSNHHLDGFLRTRAVSNANTRPRNSPPTVPDPDANVNLDSDPSVTPHVMITTSLLSRGLDFSPAIKHVFIVDEPRNMIDFLHRAGRTGRAGEKGRVVIFGKMTGRGSASAKEVRRKVGSLHG